MAPIDKAQIQRIYALGAGIGLVERGNKNDDLHNLVYRITGKESVSDLTDSEHRIVELELLHLTRYGNHPAPLKTEGLRATNGRSNKNGNVEAVPGMMNKAQQGKAWRFIYRLIELDDGDKTRSGKRMVGAIKSILGIDAGIEEPFKWINFADGIKLINGLHRYVITAERKDAKKREAV